MARLASPEAPPTPESKCDSESTDTASNMDMLPFELWEEIAAFACTDGGFTGCSLALVSKRFREASSGARFDSVALRAGTAPQLSKFLSVYMSLRSHPVHATPRLRRLYISSQDDSYDDPDPQLEGGSDKDSDSDGDGVLARSGGRVRIRARRKFLEGVSTLLKAVAPELETLVLAQCASEAYSPLASLPLQFPIDRCRFPALRELTIVGSAVVFPKAEAGAGNETERCLRGATVVYPRLTHLNLVGTTMLLAQWAECAPRVTHLRVYGKDHVRAFAAEMKEIVCGSSSGSCPMFPRLNCMVIQPYRILGHSVGSSPGRTLLGAQPVMKSVQLIFKEILEFQVEGNGRNVQVRPTTGVESVTAMERVALKEWLDGGLLNWAGDEF